MTITGRFQRATEKLWRRLRPGAVVLLYHRVTRLGSDPQALAVTPEHLAQQLEIIRRETRPLGLEEFVAGWRENRLPKRAVLVTFDDGYADNLTTALPLLEQHGVPAVFFLTSGMLGGKREFWWDQLERIMLQTAKLPDYPADLPGGPGALGDSARWTEAEHSRYSSWTAQASSDPTPRHRLYRLLCERLREMPAVERESVLEGLHAWAGTTACCRPEYRTLTAEEVSQLASRAAIGGHTRTHPLLARQCEEDQREEIAGCKRDLEEMIGGPLTSFSYPFGFRGAYDSETMERTREAGFQTAFANFGAAVRPDNSAFELPRFVVRDWDGESFARRLADWWYA